HMLQLHRGEVIADGQLVRAGSVAEGDGVTLPAHLETRSQRSVAWRSTALLPKENTGGQQRKEGQDSRLHGFASAAGGTRVACQAMTCHLPLRLRNVPVLRK